MNTHEEPIGDAGDAEFGAGVPGAEAERADAREDAPIERVTSDEATTAVPPVESSASEHVVVESAAVDVAATEVVASASAVTAPEVPASEVRALTVVPVLLPAKLVRPRSTPRPRSARRPRTTSRAARIAKIVVATVAILGVFAFLGLQGRRALLAGVGQWVSGDVRAGIGALRGVAWTTPVPFVDGLAGEGVTTRVALDREGRRAVVAHGERGRDATLWLVEIEGGRAVSERPLDEIDAPGDELAPWFDGETLWFASDRDGGIGGLDLWSARFVDGSFERPQHLGFGVNSAADDTDPTTDGARLVFASERAGNFDLWTSGVSGGTATRIAELSTAEDEREPAFARDGGSLWFAERSQGQYDLARSFRDGATWLPRERVDALSTAADERAPSPLGSGLDVAFVRPGSGNTGTALLRADSVEMRLIRPPPWTTAEVLLLASLLALATLAWFARDSSRYDTLIAAWAASILVHVAILLALGELRLHEPARAGGGGGDEPTQLRVVPSTRPSTLTGGGGLGGYGRLERASTDREIAGGAPLAGRDLATELVARAESAPVPGRSASEAPAASSAPRRVEEAVEPAIPRAEVAAAGTPLPAPGRTSRAISVGGPASAPERYDAAGASGSSLSAARTDALASGAGAPLVLAAGTSAAPAVERGVAALDVGSGGRAPRAVEEREPAGQPVAASEAPAGPGPGDVLALLGNSPGDANARAGSAPSLERYERPGPGSGADAPAPSIASAGSGDATFAPGGPSLVDDIPRRSDPAPEPAPRIAATPYETRSGPAKQRALDEHGGTRETEKAVANGLAYLARIQGKLGQWGPLEARDEKYGEICVGKTALATLAFLAAGHTHVSNSEHSRVVERALAFLIAVQDEGSGHFGDTSAYSHGIATFALAEALATTHDEALRSAVERAVAHLLDRQSRERDPRKFGGWPYYYADAERTFDPWPRTSITAWQVLALESARISGVAVPDQAFDDAGRFLDAARDDRGDWYRYSHEPARLRSQYPTLPASTPAALFALSCIGRDITTEEHAPAREYVLERAPRGYRYTNERDFVQRAQGNPYFWYQGTLAMIRVGGDAWKRWNAALQSTLLPAQERDGSWKPIDVYARYARDDDEDRSYTTALCVLCLEAYYRYDLPLLSAGRARRADAPTLEAASPR